MAIGDNLHEQLASLFNRRAAGITDGHLRLWWGSRPRLTSSPTSPAALAAVGPGR